MLIADVIVLGFAVFFTTNFIKYLLNVRILPPMKMSMVAVLAIPGAVYLGLDYGWPEAVVVWLAACAVANLVHVTHKFISALGDDRRVSTLNARARRR